MSHSKDNQTVHNGEKWKVPFDVSLKPGDHFCALPPPKLSPSLLARNQESSLRGLS